MTLCCFFYLVVLRVVVVVYRLPGRLSFVDATTHARGLCNGIEDSTTEISGLERA